MTYRLLRDNKESGPYAEEELIAKGFKPYDLIWVEGKSAGWRYPSEIPAFINFAPVVEEQPYDRFYKKPVPQKLFAKEENNSYNGFGKYNNETAYTAPQQTPAPPINIPSQPAPEYNIESLPARHIHVTLPSGNTVNLTTLAAKKETPAAKDIREESRPAAEEIKKPVVTANTQPAIAAPAYYPQPAAVKESNKKFEPAQEEPTNKTAQILYAQRPQNATVAAFSWGMIAACAIGLLTLVGLGIMIGITLGREKTDKALNEAAISKANLERQTRLNNTRPSATTTLPSGDGNTPSNEVVQPPVTAEKELVQNAVVKNTVLPENNSKNTKKETGETGTAGNNKPSANQEANALPKTTPLVINVEKSLSLTANKFKTGAFGGISDLKYTLYNGSKITIESVEVEIDYIQANDKVYKTERVLFKDISAGAQTTIEAPSSSRGIKTSTRIIKVNAKDAALANNITAKS